MREIKFRAWDSDFGSMVYEFTKDGYSLNMVAGELEVWSTDGNGDNFLLPLMQYTGLKLNGQEIWEGDIIEFNLGYLTEFDVGNLKEYGVVRFSEDGFWTSSLPGFEEELLSDELKSDAYERKIVGNIHENPELLKQ